MFLCFLALLSTHKSTQRGPNLPQVPRHRTVRTCYCVLVVGPRWTPLTFDQNRRSSSRPMGDSIDVGPTWSEPRLAAILCLQTGRRELIEKETNSLGIRLGWDPLYNLIPYLVCSYVTPSKMSLSISPMSHDWWGPRWAPLSLSLTIIW